MKEDYVCWRGMGLPPPLLEGSEESAVQDLCSRGIARHLRLLMEAREAREARGLSSRAAAAEAF